MKKLHVAALTLGAFSLVSGCEKKTPSTQAPVAEQAAPENPAATTLPAPATAANQQPEEVKGCGGKDKCEKWKERHSKEFAEKMKKWKPKKVAEGVKANALALNVCDPATHYGLAKPYYVVDAVTGKRNSTDFARGAFADQRALDVTSTIGGMPTGASVCAAPEFWLNINPGDSAQWMEFGGMDTGTDCDDQYQMPADVTDCIQAPEGTTCVQTCMAVVDLDATHPVSMNQLHTISDWLSKTDDTCTQQVALAPKITKHEFDWGIWDIIDRDTSVFGEVGFRAGRAFVQILNNGVNTYKAEYWLLNTEAAADTSGRTNFTKLQGQCAPRIRATRAGDVTGICLEEDGTVHPPNCGAGIHAHPGPGQTDTISVPERKIVIVVTK